MDHQRRRLSQAPSFTVIPDVPSPSDDSHEHNALPSISASVSLSADSDMENEIDGNVENYEDEVDQLMSDPDDDEIAPPPALPPRPQDCEQEDIEPTASEINVSAINKKSRTGKLERIPGHTLLPQSRLDSIIQAEGVMGNLSISREAAFVLSIATEEFIKRMAQTAERQAHAERRNSISYRDMARSTQQYQEFMFLRDTNPQPISLADAIRRRQKKEKEVLETIPAMASNPIIYVPNAPMTQSSSSRSRTRNRASVNGKERVNGSTNGSRRESKRDNKGRWSHGNGEVNGDEREKQSDSISSSGRSSRASRHERSDHSAPHGGSHRSRSSRSEPPRPSDDVTSMPPPPPPHDPHTDRDEHGQLRDSHQYYRNTFMTGHDWPGAFTGPASGFLQSFSRIAPQNPGRTIYSKEFHGNSAARERDS